MHFITLLSLGYKGPPNMAQGTCVWVSQFGGGLAKKKSKMCRGKYYVCVQREIKRKLVFDWGARGRSATFWRCIAKHPVGNHFCSVKIGFLSNCMHNVGCGQHFITVA